MFDLCLKPIKLFKYTYLNTLDFRVIDRVFAPRIYECQLSYIQQYTNIIYKQLDVFKYNLKQTKSIIKNLAKIY